MKRFFVCAFVLLGALTVTADEDHVIVVDADNFDTVVSQGNFVVEFYAPWCGHCKKLAPEYEKAAKLLKEMNSSVKLAKCDVDDKKNKPIATKYGVKGYPTIRLFRNGSLDNPEEYKGPRTAEGIVEEVNRAFGPASQLIQTKEDGAKMAENEAIMVGVFGKEGEESKVYLEVAEKVRNEGFTIAHTFNPKILEPCTADPEFCTGSMVFFLKAADKNISKYNGEFTVEELTEWAIKSSIPRLAELIQTSPRHMKRVQEIFAKPEPRLVAYAVPPKDDDSDGFDELKKLKDTLIEVGDAEDGFYVVFIDASINSKAARFFGIEESDCPALVMHEHSDGKKFVQKKIKAEDVKPFVAKWKANELEPTIKSEEPPKDNSGPVKVIVANTFDEFLKSGKDVFLEFYAPWCGHCKKLAPVYDKLGEQFKDNENVIIAKMDATANDITDTRFKIEGFPTLKYVKKDGEILDYKGQRTLEELKKFVNTALGVKTEDPKAKEEEPADTDSEKKQEL